MFTRKPYSIYFLFVLISLIGYIIASPTESSTVLSTTKGNCTCGGFPSVSLATDDAPLLSQDSGLVADCNEEGLITCKSLCSALAVATKAKGPEIICNKLRNADELKLSMFYKLCDGQWRFGGITSEFPLCCEEGKSRVCPSGLNATEVTSIAL